MASEEREQMSEVEPCRSDLDERAAAHYKCDVPVLAIGDEIGPLPDHGAATDRYVVDGFAAGGMLVDVTRKADGHSLCVPRKYVPLKGDPFFLEPRN